jgi:N6-adenosine-specific RNA methylase IME4
LKYKTILIDPPWLMDMRGHYKNRPNSHTVLPYPSMTIDEIKSLPIWDLADIGCHLWLWTTNQYLRVGFDLMDAWGFKFLAPITWVKPSGVGNWFVSVTQTMLMGYKEKCEFPAGRYKKTVIITSIPKRHSEKPGVTYDYIEEISPGPRLEMFSRAKRFGWDVWGNEVYPDIDIKELKNE